MKKLIILSGAFLLSYDTRCQVVSDTIGLGWAKTSVNTVIFRKNSLVTDGQIQYAAYYDSAGNVILAKKEGGGKWIRKVTRFKGNVSDAHNSISIMVDGAGFLHMAWDHHNKPLRYTKNIQPGSLELAEPLSMTGKDEKDVTYPEFYRQPSGDLLFLYRSGESGRGNLVMNAYSVAHSRWERVQETLIDGQGERNAYWQMCIDRMGTLHLSWVWRESADVASNRDLGYARSKDGGKTWEKSSGEKYMLPINSDNAEYAIRIPQQSDLINQTSMAADAVGNPYIATYWRPSDATSPDYFLVYHDGRDWQSSQISHRRLPFSLAGAGTKRIPISRPQVLVTEGRRKQVIMVYRDVERGSRISMAKKTVGKKNWKHKDLTDYSLGAWEPTYDTEAWRQKKSLELFVQVTGQGDGEQTEDIAPQHVVVLRIGQLP